LDEIERYTNLLRAQRSTSAVSASAKMDISHSTIRPWRVLKKSTDQTREAG
jgi:hypothetical protein